MNRILVPFVCIFLPALVLAEEKSPDLSNLKKEVETIVLRYYPEAKVTVEGAKIEFAFNTGKFIERRPRKDGQLQQPAEYVGPKAGGILGTIQLISGEYSAAAAMPYTFAYEHYKSYGMAPYSKEHDCHLHVRIAYPADVKEKFLTELTDLLKDFEKHLPQK
ncbi:MAG TPA: hypothetical protein VEJ63_07105 [Planctomycetota bacterium]|nr:hypothetical protein [Planctomycetota bacterium]